MEWECQSKGSIGDIPLWDGYTCGNQTAELESGKCTLRYFVFNDTAYPEMTWQGVER